MKTYSAKKSEIEHAWHLIDAKDKVLGRVAVEVAKLLRGKHKPIFTPHVDTGDYVVVINADKVKFTGKKETEKIYTYYTGYVGNQKVLNPARLRAKNPEKLLELAVKGMIPKNRLGSQQLLKLKVYSGQEHSHQAQNPKSYAI